MWIAIPVAALLSAVATYSIWLREGSRRLREATADRERAELLQTVVKLANRENLASKYLSEGLEKMSTAFTESLTKMVIGYQPGNIPAHGNSVLDLNSGDNTFPFPHEYVPSHELADPLMWDNEEADNLKPIPENGKGGWVDG